MEKRPSLKKGAVLSVFNLNCEPPIVRLADDRGNCKDGMNCLPVLAY
jgi:hypothetical protein